MRKTFAKHITMAEEKKNQNAVTAPGAETPPTSNASASRNPSGETAGHSDGIPAGAAAPPSSARWRDIIRGRNKDLNADDDEAVADYLSSEFGRLDKSDETNRRMNELIGSDPRNATMLNGIFSGKSEDGSDFNLVDYLLDTYYDDLKESANKEDMLERVNKRMAAKEQAAAEEAARSNEVEENFGRMKDALSAAISATGIDEATAQKVLDWLYGKDEEDGLYLRIPQRAITEDDFVKLIHAYTRDESLEKAREEGRGEGRRQRPGAAHRNNGGTNTDLGGGSGGAEPEKDENPTATRYRNMRPRF